MGHVFQLGRRYAEKFGLTAIDANGKPLTITMGSYGVGVTARSPRSPNKPTTI